MRRFMLFLAACLVVVSQTSLASACLNDRESDKSEKEFKSRYIENQPAPATEPETSPSTNENLFVYGGSSAGVALLISACALCVYRVRRQS